MNDLREDGIHCIVPLRENSTLIDLRWMRWKGSFLYRGRPIRWDTKGTEYGTLFAFEDLLLKGEKEQALLRKVEANKLTMAMFEQKHRLAGTGTICLVSDMDKDGIDMFDLYKGRDDVELASDMMKNRLGSDKTYL
ncbi:MAG: hypothetical protein OCU20_02810, partial [Methanophagales archaeon]|nr:hypothetical protein [Methanophagales archaeon]